MGAWLRRGDEQWEASIVRTITAHQMFELNDNLRVDYPKSENLWSPDEAQWTQNLVIN